MTRYVGNQCHHCGIFCKYEGMDSYIPYGCPNPADPEPFDPTMICKKCSEKLYNEYMTAFSNGSHFGDWHKSDAEIRAAKDSGLIWIGNSSNIIWKDRRMFNEYMPESAYNELKILNP